MRSLALLEEMPSAPAVISKLFFGANDVESELAGKSRDELIPILQGVDSERLVLANQSLQIYEYLKYNSMTRLMLACLVAECPEFMGQFLNGYGGDENIEEFESANNGILDEMVSLQSMLYEHQEDLVKSFEALKGAINGQVPGSVQLDLSVFPAAPCFVTLLMESALKTAKESGSILDEIKFSTFHKMVSRYGSKLPALSLMSFVMNPSRDEWMEMPSKIWHSDLPLIPLQQMSYCSVRSQRACCKVPSSMLPLSVRSNRRSFPLWTPN